MEAKSELWKLLVKDLVKEINLINPEYQLTVMLKRSKVIYRVIRNSRVEQTETESFGDLWGVYICLKVRKYVLEKNPTMYNHNYDEETKEEKEFFWKQSRKLHEDGFKALHKELKSEKEFLGLNDELIDLMLEYEIENHEKYQKEFEENQWR